MALLKRKLCAIEAYDPYAKQYFVCGRNKYFVRCFFRDVANKQLFMETIGFTTKKDCEKMLSLAKQEFPNAEMRIFNYETKYNPFKNKQRIVVDENWR